MKHLLASLLIISIVFGFSVPVVKGAMDAPDVTVTNITRVAGKTELKVTIANKGNAPATKKIQLKLVALPYGFCAKQSPYAPIDESGGYPCFDKPFEIPLGQRFSSVDSVRYRLALGWHTIEQKITALRPGASTEQMVSFPSAPIIPSGQIPKKLFPVPYFYDNESHAYLFAPRSLLSFDLSVFYATVDADGEIEKGNNEYFFNIRQRG